MPILKITKFILVENTFSIISGTIKLLKDGQIFLFIIITGFSILLPILKMVVLNQLLSKKQITPVEFKKYLHWMHLYGKWSMLDVFVVAILVVTVKLGAIANVEMCAGLYAFAGAVLLTMYVTASVAKLAKESLHDGLNDYD